MLRFIILRFKNCYSLFTTHLIAFSIALLFMNEYISIGKFVAAFGLTGQLVLKHILGKKTVFKESEPIFIEELKGAYLPYFIQSSKAKNKEETYLQIEGVNT